MFARHTAQIVAFGLSLTVTLCVLAGVDALAVAKPDAAAATLAQSAVAAPRS